MLRRRVITAAGGGSLPLSLSPQSWHLPNSNNNARRRHTSTSNANTTATVSASGSSTSKPSSTGGGGGDDYYNPELEGEQDKLLEEEEFAALGAQQDDEFLPFLHRLAAKADAFDCELRRLRWALMERRQLVMDTAPATFSGRPTRGDTVVGLVVTRNDSSDAAATASKTHPHPQHQQKQQQQLLAMDFSPYTNWHGVSSVPFQIHQRLTSPSSWSSFFSFSSSASAAKSKKDGDGTNTTTTTAAGGKALATLTEDIDYLRRCRALNALNYYSRMTLTPKRHIGHSLYFVLWNAWLGVQNGCGAFLFNILRDVKAKGAVTGVVTGSVKGLLKGAQFLLYGWVVSPLIHIPRGLCNSVYGPINFLTGRFMFDPMSGRWMRCTVVDSVLLRHSLQREKRMIRTVGRAEFKRKRMHAEQRWSQRLASMGFSLESFQQRMQSKRGSNSSSSSAVSTPDPYLALGVKRTATQQQIKQQYKKLAMVFHPDIVNAQNSNSGGGGNHETEKQEANDKFEAISSAYQVLSNPEKRKAYDLGGAQGLSMHEGKYGHFLSRTQEQIVQSIFGGEGLRRLLIGDLLRSHWNLRYEGQVSVSIHELEELQSIRTRLLAMELAAIVDVHAKRPASPSGGGSNGYYKNAVSGSGGGGVRRVIHSSSLPDPLGGSSGGGPSSSFANRHRAAAAASGGGVGARPSAIGRDLKEDILQELGGSEKTAGNSSRRRSLFSSSSSAWAAAAAAGDGPSSSSSSGTPAATPTTTTGSPFILVPGSNEHNCFSKDFEDRCDKFVNRLCGACFGPELLSEVGQAYTTGAMRFLGVKPFYAPKQLMTRKVLSGIDRVFDAFVEKTKKMESEELARRVMVEYFNMEYDTVVADMHVVLRYAVQMVLADCAESEEVRRRRSYAVWFLGERMTAKGTPWSEGTARDDADLLAYVQQAANSSASTSKPPTF